MSDPIHPIRGIDRNWLSLSHLSTDDRDFVHYVSARLRDFSPDQRRVVRSWFRKFDRGSFEHPPLALDTFDAASNFRQEMQDGSNYLEMIKAQLEDVAAQLENIRRIPYAGPGDPRLVMNANQSE